MALDENTANRIYNWKFGQAEVAMHKQVEEGKVALTAHEVTVITGLRTCFGNSGWFDGALGIVVAAAVHDLIGSAD